MTISEWLKARRALHAELLLACLLLGYGWFSPYRLVLLILLASHSLWSRGLGWASLGLARPPVVWRAALHATLAAGAILAAVRFVIIPVAVSMTGVGVDLSELEPIRGNLGLLWVWLAQAWTLAAFGEEMVFRGYLIRRVADVLGDTRTALTIAVAVSSVFFGWAHRYQGAAGMIATGSVGVLMALLYLSVRNLWTVILCHALVDSAGLIAIYSGHRSLLFP
jgi:membrane protease YdiL (CAAX protease family)